jgi:hypothetical protein
MPAMSESVPAEMVVWMQMMHPYPSLCLLNSLRPKSAMDADDAAHRPELSLVLQAQLAT